MKLGIQFIDSFRKLLKKTSARQIVRCGTPFEQLPQALQEFAENGKGVQLDLFRPFAESSSIIAMAVGQSYAALPSRGRLEPLPIKNSPKAYEMSTNQANLLVEARQLRGTLRSMTNLLVADPYFPYAFPYVHDYYQEHGELPLLEGEEDGDVAVAPVLVQIAPPNGMGFVVEGEEEEEDPEEPPEEEYPEEPKEDSEDEEEFHDPPQNEADWQHLMQMQHLNEINEGWQSDDDEEEIVCRHLPNGASPYRLIMLCLLDWLLAS
ncbi:hypothetical protein RHMOL_Rhmol01G0185400 [Rhododendron molle]|uniref:Uncharacterized protein n=1 Tax=Rhododendron molle TaxID=49168 RepID=A0ACC0Q4T7_RHOML|nr:hypothetical protein RHMOL_Rhmol01G0185400 [Rhododendron molle]